jgi:hypothetical protein
VTSGFAHFDENHRENFYAAVVLLVMELDEDAKRVIAGLVCDALRITSSLELVAFGREARLHTGDGEDSARVDIWLLFRGEHGLGHAFVEVKTHDRWDPHHVAAQVFGAHQK